MSSILPLSPGAIPSGLCTPSPRKVDVSYKCEFCMQVFANLANLKQHPWCTQSDLKSRASAAIIRELPKTLHPFMLMTPTSNIGSFSAPVSPS